MTETTAALIVDKIETVHKCLDEHIRTSAEWRQRIEAQLTDQDRRLEHIELEGKRTSETVASVDAAVKTAKTVKTLVSWISAVTIGVASTWFAIKSFWTNQSPL